MLLKLEVDPAEAPVLPSDLPLLPVLELEFLLAA
jgi:hypothetical protein